MPMTLTEHGNRPPDVPHLHCAHHSPPQKRCVEGAATARGSTPAKQAPIRRKPAVNGQLESGPSLRSACLASGYVLNPCCGSAGRLHWQPISGRG
jgi:hypothetical protein